MNLAQIIVASIGIILILSLIVALAIWQAKYKKDENEYQKYCDRRREFLEFCRRYSIKTKIPKDDESGR